MYGNLCIIRNIYRFFKSCTIVFTTILFGLKSYSQNLLVNGSFEDENICVELKQRCSPAGWVTTSLNVPFLGTTYSMEGLPLNGNHFIQLIASNSDIPEFRTFLSTKLLCSLRKGKSYRIDFYARSTSSFLDSLGIYFSSYDFIYEKKKLHEIQPSVWIKSEEIWDKNVTTPWAKKSAIIIATGKEIFFTIGAFKRNDIPVSQNEQNQLLLLDNISIIPTDSTEQLCADSDSLKRVLYLQTERHGMLLKKIASFINHYPPVIKPSQTVLCFIDTLRIPDLLFKTGSADINSGNNNILDDLLRNINQKNIDSILIIGHSDNVGSYQYNMELSLNRSKSIAKYLISASMIDQNRIFVKGAGYTQPITTNQTKLNKPKNRRVEVFLFRHL